MVWKTIDLASIDYSKLVAQTSAREAIFYCAIDTTALVSMGTSFTITCIDRFDDSSQHLLRHCCHITRLLLLMQRKKNSAQ
jgi:hypothetical protein